MAQTTKAAPACKIHAHLTALVPVDIRQPAPEEKIAPKGVGRRILTWIITVIACIALPYLIATRLPRILRERKLDAELAELNKGNDVSHYHRGQIYYLKRDWKNALSDFRAAMETGSHENNAHLFIWILRVRLGEKDAADKELAAYMERVRSSYRDVFGDFFLGRGPEPALTDPQQMWPTDKTMGADSDTSYFLGIRKLLAGDPKGAIRYFRTSVNSRQWFSDLYRFSESELIELNALESRPLTDNFFSFFRNWW